MNSFELCHFYILCCLAFTQFILLLELVSLLLLALLLLLLDVLELESLFELLLLEELVSHSELVSLELDDFLLSISKFSSLPEDLAFYFGFAFALSFFLGCDVV